MKKHHLFASLLVLLSTCLQAQNKQEISGQVISTNDSTFLEFAHIYIKNGFIGTYTNAEGKFTLNYPDSLAQDTLVVSRIGYGNIMLPLIAQDTSRSLSIYVPESSNYLDEVVITTQKDTVAAFVKKVLRRFRKNYPTKLHYLEGFYRELSLKGDNYTRLIEASIGITENSYRKDETTTKIKIKQIRKSEDYRAYDVKRQLWSAAMKKMMKIGFDWQDYNSIRKLLGTNIAKMDHRKILLFAQENDFIDAFDFTITKVSIENGNKLYHITFQTDPSTTSPLNHYGGEIIINVDDSAIIEWKYRGMPHPYKTMARYDFMYYKGKFAFQNHIIYSKFGDKYYPTFFEVYKPILEASNHVYENGREEYQFDKMTFMVNQIITKKRDFDRIKKREALEDELDLYDVEHPYDAGFWVNYNILLIDPLLKPTIEDLEKEKSLDEQFESNGE
ncbi:MAG: carboxypeptidase-like regulatory domain-containing protein [Ekhidna sp.]